MVSLFVAPVTTSKAILTSYGTAKLMTNRAFVNWLAKHSRGEVSPNGLSNALTELRDIVKRNPDIADEVSQYLTTIGIIGGSK